METRAKSSSVSLGYLALVGAVAGGAPCLVIPTATLVDLVGNSVMGAVVTVMLELILLRRTLPPELMRRGRLFVVIMVSTFLTLVTYRPAKLVFQTVFDTAPPRPGVSNLAARTINWTANGGTGAGYRLVFEAEPTALQNVRERMEPLLKREGAGYEEFAPTAEGGGWKEFVTKHLPGDSPLMKPALDFVTPQGWVWTSPTPNGGKAKTVLLYDVSTKLALTEHRAG